MHTKLAAKTSALVLISLIIFSAQADWALDFGNTHGSNDDDHVQFGNIGNAAEYTAEAWINPRRISGDGDHATLGFMIFGCASDYSLWLLHRNGEVKAYAYENSTTAFTETVGAGIETNTFTHVALTAVHNGTAQIFVNGVLLETFNAGSRNSWGNLTLGVLRAGRGIGMDGIIMEARLWNHVRSQADLQQFMYTRLSGDEEGLLGYWPMNEGEGGTVYDGSGNDRDGTINGPSWVFLAESPFDIGEDFFSAPPFTLADQQTGSSEFTNSNEVDLVDFPIMEGYDRFQFTESGEIVDIDNDGWESTNAVPERLLFTQPSADSSITLYAWFTNSNESVTLRRAQGTIVYTSVAPVPVILSEHARERLPGQPVTVFPEEIDDGSSGGEALGLPLGIHRLSLTLVSGPDTDATPDKPYVTISELGEYRLLLTVVNAAGNTALSSATNVLTVTEFGGQCTWTGAGDGNDWHDPRNWEPFGVPVDGVPVVIDNGASVWLRDSTAALSALTIENAALTMAHWETVLTAGTVTVGDGGVITHDGPHNSFLNTEWPDWAPSNRIHIVCTDLTVASGGALNADFRGYSGGRREGTGMTTEWGHGPGASRGVCSNDEAKAGGAGHGGRGGNGRPTPGGPVYGCPIHPETPGSGAGGGHSAAGAHGGGVIRVNSSGRITVDGIVSANGANASTAGPRHTAGGAGGSIYLSCETFAGQGGIVRANGGDKAINHSGGGGGGRIALHYDAAAQTSEPLPSVIFTAAPGDNYPYRHMVWYWNWCRRGTGTGFSEEAQWGSLYFTDPTGVIGLGSGDTVDNISGFLHFGEGVAFANGTLEFALDNLTVTNGATLGFETNSTITITGDLDIAPGSGLIARHSLSLAVGGELRLKGKLRADRETALDIGGDLTIDGGRLRIRKPEVAIGGTLALLNDGWLVTQALEDGADGQVVVAGDIMLAPGSWIHPVSHQTAGGATRFVCRELHVAEGAGFDADGAGYSADQAGPGGGTQYASTSANQGAGGGGYGGRGGDGLMRAGGSAYPADYDACCLLLAHPGSAGGRSFQVEQAGGGGAIWIETDGPVHLDGVLRANGHDGRSIGSRRPGSGSGGGILVITERLYGGPQSVIEALGGAQSYDSATAYGGAGGGGRIAIWHGLKTADRQPLLDDLDNPSVQRRIVAVDSLPQYHGEPITALAGVETRPPSEDGRVDAVDGTVAFLKMLAPPGTMIMLR